MAFLSIDLFFSEREARRGKTSERVTNHLEMRNIKLPIHSRQQVEASKPVVDDSHGDRNSDRMRYRILARHRNMTRHL